jgi:hypothetical protein
MRSMRFNRRYIANFRLSIRFDSFFSIRFTGFQILYFMDIFHSKNHRDLRGHLVTRGLRPGQSRGCMLLMRVTCMISMRHALYAGLSVVLRALNVFLLITHDNIPRIESI